jgi:hypothetical protein
MEASKRFTIQEVIMWFTASVLFKSESQTATNKKSLWEERIISLEAEDESEAEQKAMRCGKIEEHEYRNQAGETVRWHFERIERIYKIEGNILEDGTELFSRFLKDSEVESLLKPFDD